MHSEDDFAQWASMFIQNIDTTPPAAATDKGQLTPAAKALLQSVDAGGIPAFMTTTLKQIAQDNGISVVQETTPNEIIATLRKLALPPEDAL